MPFTLAAPHSEVEPSRPQEIQRASYMNTNTVSDTVTTTNHHPQRQRSACSLLMYTLKTNSMVRYGVLIFIIALISILYFATTHQVLKPTGAGPTITSELLTFNPKNIPDTIQKSSDDGFPTSIGGTQLYETYDANGKGNVQQKVEGTLTNNTGQNIRGILYDRGDGCQSINLKEPPPLGVYPSIPVPDVLLPYKIGLITSGTTSANPNCTLDTKIKNSITDKDTALIFTLQNDMDEALNLRQNDYEITIFTINKLAGKGLLDELGILHRKYLSNIESGNTVTVLTVTLSPYRQLVVSSWLFAMFAVGGILVASFFVSIIIHMRLYRLRRNQQDEVRRQRAVDEELGMKKWTLDKEDIDTFPIVVYVKKTVTTSSNVVESTNDAAKSSTSDSDEQNENNDQNKNDESTSNNRQLHRSGSTRSTKSTRSLNAINNATNLYNSSTTPTTPITSTTPMTPTSPTSQTVSTTPTTSVNSTTPTASATAVTDDNDVDTCAICIEDFEEGEELRLLPCKHWYHVECIDPWLTTKSSSCPLCKTDCRPNQIQEIVLDSRPNQDNNVENEGSERNNSNVVGRMSKAVGKLFGSIGRRSTSVRPVNTQQPQQPQPQQPQLPQQSRNNNDSTVVELEMENINSS